MIKAFKTLNTKRAGTHQIDSVKGKALSGTIRYELIDGPCVPYYDYDNSYTDFKEGKANTKLDFQTAYLEVFTKFSDGNIISLSSCGISGNKWKNSFHFIVRGCGYCVSGTDIPMTPGCDSAVYKQAGKQQKFRLPMASKEGESRPLIFVDSDMNEIVGDYEHALITNIMDEVQRETLYDHEELSKKMSIAGRHGRTTKYDTPTVESVSNLVNMLKQDRADDYSEWLTVMLCLKNIACDYGIDLMDVADEFSRRSDKYKEGEVAKYFVRDPPKGLAKVGMGTLVYWAKNDSPGNFRNTVIPGTKAAKLELIQRCKDEPRQYQMTDINDLYMEEITLEDLYKRFTDSLVHVFNGGNHVIMSITMATDGSYVYTPIKQPFTGDNDFDLVIDGKNTKLSRAYKEFYLLDSYNRIVFEPTLVKTPTKDFNTFPGFPFTYKRMAAQSLYEVKCKSIMKVIDLWFNVMCGGVKTDYEYMVKYIAHMIQKPNQKPNTCIILWGNKKGTGKNTSIEIVQKMIGSNLYYSTDKLESLTQRFNVQLANKLLCVCNEIANFSNMKEASSLKSLITESERFIEPKGMEQFKVSAYERHIWTSQTDQCAIIENGDRRYHMIHADIKRERSYYAYFYENIINDSKTATKERHNLFRWLSNIDLTGFEPNDIPWSESKKSTMLSLLPSPVKYLMGRAGIKDCKEIELMYQDYHDWCMSMSMSDKSIHKTDKFGRIMKQFSPTGVTRVRMKEEKARQYTFNTHALRKEIDLYFGWDYDWEQAEAEWEDAYSEEL